MSDLPWWVKPTLAALISIMLIAALGMSYVAHDDASRQIIIGAIVAQFSGAIGFYFGSSDSSQKKDETIAAANAALATSSPPPPKP